MGLFNAILRGCGLEDEELKQHTIIKPKKKEETNNMYETFNLHQKLKEEQPSVNRSNFTTQTNNLAIFAPKTQQDIQKIILSLKLEQSCIVNLQNIPKEDSVRVLDFFSGAVFALGGDINRIQGDLFLVTPKMVQIKVN